MGEPTSAETAEHYVWGEGCDGWHLARGDQLSVLAERMPAGTQERRHFHRHARQFFYVLAGELTMEVEGRCHTLPSGHGIEIAPGEWHQAGNRSSEDVRFLVISAPPAQGDREYGSV